MSIPIQPLIFIFLFLLTQGLFPKKDISTICSYNVIKNRVKAPCEGSLKPLGATLNGSQAFYNCAKPGPVVISEVYFNATPTLNDSFGVYLVSPLFSFKLL